MADEDEEELEEIEDDDGEEDGEEGEPKGGGKKKLILILVAVTIVLLSLIGGGLFISGILDPLLGIEETDGEGEEHALGTAFYKLEDITLNLGGDEEKSRFFKIGLTIVLTNDLDIPVVEALVPRIIDNVSAYLRELKPGELAGSANFDRLRENIQLRVRAAVAPTPVSDVLFHSALIQ
jgi:flagellar FliL protein